MYSLSALLKLVFPQHELLLFEIYLNILFINLIETQVSFQAFKSVSKFFSISKE